MTLRALLAPFICLLATAATPATYEIALWADDEDAARRPGVVRVEAHACGTVAIVRLAAMPPWREGGHEGLGTDLIAEAGARPYGALRWSVPVDYQPIAIRGREILIDAQGRRLWIGAAGSIRRETAGRRYPAPRAMICPAGGVHAGSEYARCAGLTDLASGRMRTIQYEGVCT